MDRQQVLSIFKESGALLDGHFQLTSGLHSNQYFQCAKVLQYPKYMTALCSDIAMSFAGRSIDVVIAPAMGGIVVGQEVGRLLGARTMFTERKESVMQLRRGFEIRRGERVLVCEDVVTTGGSVFEVMKIVNGLGGAVVGVGFIVDRSGGRVKFEVAEGGMQHSVLQMDVVTYKPDSCPLCKQGLAVDKPGSRGNK
ncbi:MAG TPA: orotate phosphoribosyltransferase [Bacteroidetes bacterium]|jgi:orotate phosphoribosyltransferase|nr:orotate phosphoribosyltransferase [Bacteroidota bacterium]